MPSPPSLRGLLSRVRSRLNPQPTVIGLAYSPHMVDEWMELEEQVDGYLKKIGASIVGSWEVAAAELARKLVGRPDEKLLIDRFSDGLVPALQPFQDLHKGVPSAFYDGKRDGGAQGTLAAATRPLVVMIAGLDGRAEAGWAKMVEYLGPIYAVGNQDVARSAMLAAGPKIAVACAASDVVLRERLSKLPQAKTLWDGVCEPFDAYQLALTRELEIEIHRATRGMIAAVGDKGS